MSAQTLKFALRTQTNAAPLVAMTGNALTLQNVMKKTDFAFSVRKTPIARLVFVTQT